MTFRFLIESLITTENLNSKYWILVYETIYKGWINTLSNSIVLNHFYFNRLKNAGVYFYDENKTLDPLIVEKSYIKKRSSE